VEAAVNQGLNAARQKGLPVYHGRSLGIITIVYVPFKSGYYSQVMDIFKLHSASLRQYTSEPFDYIVFDNGSCSAVKEELSHLHAQGWIDELILSRNNLGITGAQNAMLSAIQNEWVCYTDSDMLFRPGWFEASRQIYESFANTGAVSAQLFFPDEIQAAQSHGGPDCESSRFQAESWLVDEFCQANAIPPEKRLSMQHMWLEKLTHPRSRVEAVVNGGTGQQWLSRRKTIQSLLPFEAIRVPNQPENNSLDRQLAERGWRNLATPHPYLVHMGNRLDERQIPEVRRLNGVELSRFPAGTPGMDPGVPADGLDVWFSRTTFGRRAILRLYDRLYHLLNQTPS
jgi:hypothetical protein